MSPIVPSLLMGLPLAMIALARLPYWLADLAALCSLTIALGIPAYLATAFLFGCINGVRLALELRKEN